MAYYNTYNPSQNSASSLWDTDWAKKATASNPYLDYYTNAGSWAKQQMGNVQSMNPMTSGAGGGQAAWYGGYPDLSNPETQKNIGLYGEGVMSQQRNALDDYVKRASTAGIQRGGYNVAGGPAYGSSLHQDAINSLSSGAADRFKGGLDYTKGLYGAMYSGYNQQADLATKLMGLWNQGLQEGAGWDTNLFNQRSQDYRTDQQAQQQWQSGEAARQAQYRQQLAQEQAQTEARYEQLRQNQVFTTMNSTPWGAPLGDAARQAMNEYMLKGYSPYWMGGAGKKATGNSMFGSKPRSELTTSLPWG